MYWQSDPKDAPLPAHRRLGIERADASLRHDVLHPLIVRRLS